MPGQIPKIVDYFYGSIWAIEPDKLRTMEVIVSSRMENIRFEHDEIRAYMGQEPAEKKRYQVTSAGVAIIPVYGVIDKRADWFMDVSGGCSTDRLRKDFAEAMADPNVHSIVLDVDSPGGSVAGTAEAAEFIRANRGKKKIVAVANELMASAAYWIGSAADEIVAPSTANIGSIGVYMLRYDRSKMLEGAGVRVQMVKAGALKGSGEPSQPITDEEVAYFQERIDQIYDQFVTSVATNRNRSASVIRHAATGAVYLTPAAMALGLVDRTGTLDSVVEELSRGKSRSTVKGASAMADSLHPTQTAAPSEPSGVQTSNVNPTVLVKPQSANDEAIRTEERNRCMEIKAVAAAIWDKDQAKASAVADELIAAGTSVVDAKAYITDRLTKERKPIAPIQSTESAAEKFAAIASTGLQARIAGPSRLEKMIGARGLTPDERYFSRMSLLDLARASLAANGVPDADRMSNDEVADRALGWEMKGMPRSYIPRESLSSNGAYHTSGDFPNLLLDAVNKTMLIGYKELRTTWRQWVRVGPAVRDFKNINKIRMSEAPTLEVIPEDGVFPQGRLFDGRETYAVQTYGKAFSFTRKMLIDDDMDAISKIPTMWGRAAERTINQVVYALLTSNPTMAEDNVALFSDRATGDNLLAAGAPSVSTLNLMQQNARKMKSFQSVAPLGIELRHLIVPTGYEGTAKELIMSPSYSTAGVNSGVINIWQNALNLIVEPLLDVASATQWYGAISAEDGDTVEVTFLEGEESPITADEYDFDTKGRKFTIHQSFGAKVLDFRGLFRNG